MKVASIHLKNFKRFEDLKINLRNSLTDDIADRFLLLGDNGTGKTTVLQAGLTHHNKPSRLFGQG